MPDYTIETTYHLPVFRHRAYSADTPEAACRAAIEDDDWEHGRRDYDSSGETYVTGIWPGRDTAYAGEPLPIPRISGRPRSVRPLISSSCSDC
ncbi:MAG: hypothetical protein AB7F74_14020 [Parvibaculaceae bacterium]